MESNLDTIDIDLWLEELIFEFKNSFQADGKVLHFYPTQPVGQVLVDTITLDKLLRFLLATIRTFAHDTQSIEVALRREKAVFLILIEHNGSPVPVSLRDQILRSIPANLMEKSKLGAPAPDELLASWAHILGGNFSTIVSEGTGISYMVQLPLRQQKTFPISSNYSSSLEFNSVSDAITNWNDIRIPTRAKILIVEDNPNFREILNNELNTFYEIDFAVNGRDGLDKVTLNQDYDLIISDVMMPEMNGFAFAEAVRSMDEQHNVPFLFLTSLSNPEDLVRGISSGADAYLMKPIRIEMLKAHLLALLMRKSVIQKNNIEKLKHPTLKQRVDKLILEHMGNPEFSVDSIASLLGTSRSAFYRSWAETGEEPVNTRILKSRLSFAIQIMKTDDYSIAQVASASGFSDAGYFSKAFKKVYGVNPSKYP